MGAGLTITPVHAVLASDYVRPAADTAHGAIATAVPDVKTVTSAAGTPATPQDVPQTAAASTASLTQKFAIDPQTREVIYRLVDTRTQQVIEQVPDHAMLATRAYSDAIQNGASPTQAQVQADIES
jgi:hypothetical protein